jgi:tRNA (guanine10-N2)-dimethyltransferase
MIQSLCILGRQPALGIAELEMLYGANNVVPLSEHVAGLTLDAADVDFARLGGSTRLASVVGEVDSVAWPQIEKAMRTSAVHIAKSLPTEGKIKLGISVYGLDINSAKLTAAGLTIKKILRSGNRSVRLVPNQAPELSTAQVFHNALTGDLGIELLIVAGENSTVIAHTTAVQDIDSYTVRDRGRPKRDARVGMLPPKLAQIIVNLAVGPQEPSHDVRLLDPFCGTGVILQEALLMGYGTYGTDLEPRMISYTKENIEWFLGRYNLIDDTHPAPLTLEVGDATSHRWVPAPDYVAGETYLGRPFTTAPSREVLEQTITEVNTILLKFINNLHRQLRPGTHLCLAVPAWQTNADTFRHLPLTEHLADSRYKRVNLVHARNRDLIYYREGQIVARELLVLESI